LSSTRRGGWGWLAIWPVLAAVIGLGGGFALGRTIRAASPNVEEAMPSPPPAPAVAPIVVPPRAAPPKMTAHIHSSPEGAQVVRASDGEPLGVTPFELELPGADRGLGVLFLKKGFETLEQELPASGEDTVRVTLAPARRGKPAKQFASASPRPPTTHAQPVAASPPRSAPPKVASPPSRLPARRTAQARGGARSSTTTIDPFQ
jgi:hypothetical protein